MRKQQQLDSHTLLKKATLNSDEDIIIKEEKGDEAVIKMIRKQDFEKVMENINSLSHDNDKNVTGEQKGDGSPVEEGNGIGGRAEEEGDGTVEEIGHGINTETSIDDDQEGEQLEFEDKELAIYW